MRSGDASKQGEGAYPDHRGISRSAPPLGFSWIYYLTRGGVKDLAPSAHPVIDYHLETTCTASYAARALKNALRKRGLRDGLVMPKLRTDNGP